MSCTYVYMHVHVHVSILRRLIPAGCPSSQGCYLMVANRPMAHSRASWHIVWVSWHINFQSLSQPAGTSNMAWLWFCAVIQNKNTSFAHKWLGCSAALSRNLQMIIFYFEVASGYLCMTLDCCGTVFERVRQGRRAHAGNVQAKLWGPSFYQSTELGEALGG